MNHDEDASDLNLFASQLAALRPADSIAAQRDVFYRAGVAAGKLELRQSQRRQTYVLRAASVLLLATTGWSGFTFGVHRGSSQMVAKNPASDRIITGAPSTTDKQFQATSSATSADEPDTYFADASGTTAANGSDILPVVPIGQWTWERLSRHRHPVSERDVWVSIRNQPSTKSVDTTETNTSESENSDNSNLLDREWLNSIGVGQMRGEGIRGLIPML